MLLGGPRYLMMQSLAVYMVQTMAKKIVHMQEDDDEYQQHGEDAHAED